ncbi:MAG: ABC transporter permease, partial [Peptococcaceae bacterium]|nr:ABC transporter permease [Peptococcaceae bacterium]
MLKRWLKKDRAGILPLITLPVFLMIIFCNIFGGRYIEHIALGVADLDHSSLSRAIVESFASHPGFDLQLYEDAEEALRQDVYTKKISVGLVLPAGLAQGVQRRSGVKALVFVDGTNMLTGTTAQGYVTAIMSSLNSKFQQETLLHSGVPAQMAGQRLQGFTFGERVLFDPQMSYLMYLFYLMIPFLIQQFYTAYHALPLFVREREAGTLTWRNKFLYFRLGMAWLVIFVSTVTVLFLAAVIFHMAVPSGLLRYLVLLFSFLFALTAEAWAISFLATSRNVRFFIEVYVVIAVVFLLTAGATWPEYMIPAWLRYFIGCIWPYMHLALPYKALIIKDLGWSALAPYIGKCLIFGSGWLLIGSVLCWRQGRSKSRRDAASSACL